MKWKLVRTMEYNNLLRISEKPTNIISDYVSSIRAYNHGFDEGVKYAREVIELRKYAIEHSKNLKEANELYNFLIDKKENETSSINV